MIHIHKRKFVAIFIYQCCFQAFPIRLPAQSNCQCSESVEPDLAHLVMAALGSFGRLGGFFRVCGYLVFSGGLSNVARFAVRAEHQVHDAGVVVVSSRSVFVVIDVVFVTQNLRVHVQELGDQILQPAKLGFRRKQYNACG